MIKIFIIPLFILFGITASSQTTEHYQRKIDSLELIRVSLSTQLDNINEQINSLKQLKTDAWANEQVGQIYVFKRDGVLYDTEKSYIEIGTVKKGTRILYVKDKGTIGMIALVNGAQAYVVKHYVESLSDMQNREIEKKIQDSIALADAKPYVFIDGSPLYKSKDDIDSRIRVPVGTEMLFVKNVNGRFANCQVLYNGEIFYTNDGALMSVEEYQRRTEEQQKAMELIAKKNAERKRSLISKYGSVDGKRIYEHKIWIGMTKEMLIESWGEPNDINRTVTASNVSEQCVYGSQYVYLDNGIVTAWQD